MKRDFDDADENGSGDVARRGARSVPDATSILSYPAFPSDPTASCPRREFT